MWCVSCFHPGPQQNIIMCKVQIAMDDTTRVHIIQGRSHLTASRGKQDKARVAPVAPGFGRSGVSVGGFLQKFFPSNCWLFGQIFGRKLDPSQNFTDSKFPWRQKVRRGDNNSNGMKKIALPFRGGRTCKAASWTHKCGSIWLESKVSRITEAKSPPAAGIGGDSMGWVGLRFHGSSWRDGLRMDMVWKYGLLWILCIINSINSFISILYWWILWLSLPACHHNILSFGNVLVFQDLLLQAS